MKRADRRIPLVTAVTMAVAILLSGCQTTDDKSTRIAAMGFNAAFSGALAVLTGGTVMGSAFTGAMTTAAVGDYQTKKMRSTPEEKREYGVTTPLSSPQIRIQKVGNSPKWARTGQRVDIWTRYWLNLPSGESTASATESWVIKGEGISPVTLGPTQGEREGGKRESRLDFRVPEGVAPGTYRIEHRVESGSSVGTMVSEFVVIPS